MGKGKVISECGHIMGELRNALVSIAGQLKRIENPDLSFIVRHEAVEAINVQIRRAAEIVKKCDYHKGYCGQCRFGNHVIFPE